MTRSLPITIGAIFFLILVAYNTTYTVKFHELAILTRFGSAAGVDREPGLHLKWPFFIDQVTRIDTRMQMVESPNTTIMLADNQQVVIQAFVLWRVDDGDEGAMAFFTRFSSLDAASRSIEQELPGAFSRIQSYRFGDLIGAGSKLAEAEASVLAELQGKNLPGVKLVSVGISQIGLPPKAAFAVLGRMAEVQVTLAREQESRGTSEAKSIESTAASEADIIRRFAEQWAAEIRARGDAEAARYYAKMNEYGDLAVFLAWLDTLKAGMTGAATIIADTKSAPMHLLNVDSPTNANGIPMPTEGFVAQPRGSAAAAPVPAGAQPAGKGS